MLRRTLLIAAVIVMCLLAVGCSPTPSRTRSPARPSRRRPNPPNPAVPVEAPVDTPPEPADQPAEPAVEPVSQRVINDRTMHRPIWYRTPQTWSPVRATVPPATRGLSNGGDDLSFDTLWRASMMAHAAKDPYWQATVSTETEEFPELTEVIADKCASCHMPLAHFDATVNGETPLDRGRGLSQPRKPTA